MLLKIIGSFMIIGASSLIGYVYSKDCAGRPQQLRILQNLLQMFENEISFMSNLLVESFNRVERSSSSPVAAFFRETAVNLKESRNQGLSASAAWEKALKNNAKNTALKKEDLEVLISFGKMLGNSDLEGQVKNIRLTINQLGLQEQKAEESRKKNETMYKSLGFLGGLAIVILLI